VHNYQVSDDVKGFNGMDLVRLREAVVWARIFIRESNRELIGSRNNTPRTAQQLMAILALLTK
jgi:hypothetical protein